MIGAVAHYNLLEHAGEGELGPVYRARDTRVGRTVALKLIPRGTGPRHERLLDDARMAAALSHPNIATLFDIGEHDGHLYFAYEFVQGSSLRQIMNGAPVNVRRALDLGLQVADALAAAHAQGLVHKDLRPETILETAKGSAKVLDFGMALWTRGGQMRALAAAAPDSVGSDAAPVVAYMSPEQSLGGPVDARTDIFSLAVVLYEMLTGVHPFAAADPQTTLINVTQRSPAPPTSVNGELPKMLDVVLGRALSKSIDARTPTAVRFAAELRRCRQIAEPGDRDVPVSSASPLDGAAEMLPLEEERGAGTLWWLLAALGVGVAIAVYFLLTRG